MKSSIIEPDAWLGAQMRCPAYRVRFPESESIASQTDLLRIAMSDLLGDSCFAFCKIPVSQPNQVRILTDIGFCLVETSIQFRKDCNAKPRTGTRCRFSVVADVDRVGYIAEASFSFSRFHMDPEIDRDLANALKREWALNYFRGMRGDKMAVAEVDGLVVAFVLLLCPDGRDAVIDLLAVHPDYHRHGLGRELCEFAEVICGASQMVVGTQVANNASVRFYEDIGYRQVDASYVFHVHCK